MRPGPAEARAQLNPSPRAAEHTPDPVPCRNRRRPGVRTGHWLAVDAAGDASWLEPGKHAVMRRTGLPARDLRILDPQLSYPSTLLGRERAVVVNVEHIRAVLTAHEVLLLNAGDHFVAGLQRRLRFLHRQGLDGAQAQETKSGIKQDRANMYITKKPQSRNITAFPGTTIPKCPSVFNTNSQENEKGRVKAESVFPISNHSRVLPFEFVALEACLESACSCLENEAASLELEAYPVLDKLTSKISTLNLEHVRQIKSRLVAITGRVHKVRDELEQLLDDDDDMAEMYLTDKLIQQRLWMDNERACTEISSDENEVHNNSEEASQINENRGTFSSRSESKHHNVEELEMLLEAYFVQIDSTLNKLSTLREYVDDTEDYINIMLDDKQNQLLQMGVMLTTATLILSAFVLLAGIFGMNIDNNMFDEKKSSKTDFWWTVSGGSAGILFLYFLALAWCKHRRLLE